MDIQDVVKKYNQEHKKLDDISKELNYSKGAISKALKANGYVLNKALKQYIKETVNTGNNKTLNNVSRETLNTENSKTVKMVKCTFDLPSDLAMALKLKSTLEGTKMVKIVEKTLRNAIEDKYFNIK